MPCLNQVKERAGAPPPHPWGREGGCVGECVRLKRRARVRRSRSAIKKVGGKSAQMRESEKGRRDEEDDSLLGEVLAERRQKKAEEWAKQKTMKWLP